MKNSISVHLKKKWKCDYIGKDCRYLNPALVFVWMDYLDMKHPQLTNPLMTHRRSSSERWKGAECAEIFSGICSRRKLPRTLKILMLQSALAHANTDIALPVPFVCLFSFVLIFPLPPSWCFCQHIVLSGERDGDEKKKKKGIHSGPVCICSIYEMGTLIPGVLSAAFAHYTPPLALLSAPDTDSSVLFSVSSSSNPPWAEPQRGTYWAETELTAKN